MLNLITYTGSLLSLRSNNLIFTAFAVLLISILSGCVSTERTEDIPTPEVIQWPGTEPAITFVKSITSFQSSKRSVWQKIGAVITGRRAEDRRIVKPVAVSVSDEGSIAIADPANSMVHYYNAVSKKYLRISSVKSGDELVSPVGVVFDKRSRLFIADSVKGEVYAFDRDGSHLFSLTYTEEGHFMRPTGLAYNTVYDLVYVADTLANRISIFDFNGRFISSFGGNGISQGKFNFPTYIFGDNKGLLYVTDAMNFRVQIFEAYGEFVSEFGHHGDGSGDFAMPKGIAVDKNDTVYVVDSLFDNLQLFNSEGRLLLTVGQQGTELGEFWLPSGAFIDGRGYLYVCDTYNRRVQVFKIHEDVLE